MQRIKYIPTLLCGVIFILTLGGFQPAGTSIAVIINKDNPVAKMTPAEVKLYWLRKIKSRWPELNKNIRPVDRKSKCAEQDVFYDKVLNMPAQDVETFFLTRQYQNAQKPQDKFATDAEIISFISDEPGAIGFVNSGSVTGDVKARVKVVLTISN